MKNNNFIERSIVGALSFFRESILSDEHAFKKGLLQSLDPRFKVVTLLLFIVQAVLLRDPFLIACLYVFSLLLAFLSRINLIFFLKRTWVFIPLFSLFIAVPAVFSVFIPGDSLIVFSVAGLRLAVTRQGLNTAAIFVTRVATSVSFAVLLSITTRHFQLLRALRVLGIPQVFVMTLGICHRYIYLFVGIIQDTYLAIKSRVGTRLHYRKGQRIVAWNIASLWWRSYHLNEEVYKAMLSRGYRGESPAVNDEKAGLRDWVWLSLCAAVFILLVYLNYRNGA